MKTLLPIILLITLPLLKGYSQNYNSKDWLLLEKENIKHHTITKSESFSIDNYIFDVVWNDKLSFSENLGYYGGISNLKIHKNNELVGKFDNIKDGIALGEIRLEFYDFNFDGYLDFRLPIGCGKICWKQYYLYNSKARKFQHFKDWDYLRIQKINKEKKLILTVPDGNSTTSEQKLFKVVNNELKLLKTTVYE